MQKTAIERFMSRVEMVAESGCWIWVGNCNNYGYGNFYHPAHHLANKPQFVAAHRWSIDYFKGPISKSNHVCHRCDVPSCVNPDHLWVGTHQENMADLWSKGRGTKGRKFPEREKQFCSYGHEYTPDNTMYAGAKKHKRCRACTLRRKRENWLRHREELLAKQKLAYRARVAAKQHTSPEYSGI